MTLFFHPGDLEIIPLLLAFVLLTLLVLAVIGWLIWTLVEVTRWNARKKGKLDKKSNQKNPDDG